MSGIVDLQFTAQTGTTVTELQKVLEKLKEINGLSSLNVKVDGEKANNDIINNTKKRLKTQQDLEVQSATETQKRINAMVSSNSGKSAKGSGSDIADAQKAMMQLEDMKRLQSSALRAGLTESLTLIKQYTESLQSQIPLTDLELKKLQTKISMEKDSVSWQEQATQREQKRSEDRQKALLKEEELTKKTLLDEQKKLWEIDALRKKIREAPIAPLKQGQLGLDLHSLEKRLSDENFNHDLDLIKKIFNEEVKYEQQFSKLRIEEDNKVFKAQQELITRRKEIAGKQLQQAIVDNTIVSGGKSAKDSASVFAEQFRLEEQEQAKRLALAKKAQEEKKRIEKEALDNKAQLLKLENTLIRNNMSDELRMSLNNLKNKKDLNKQELKDFEIMVNKQLTIRQQSAKIETFGNKNIALSSRLFNQLKPRIEEAAKFEQTLYHMGVVGEKGAAQIDDMRSAMFDLGREIPRATQEIIENIIKVETMGYTYEQSLGVVRESAKLAVASGEGIAKSTDVLTKILVAFNIESERTAEVMNSVHTAAVRTPLDLQKIDEAMRNAGSGMRNFIESTNKSGDDLERYKIQILNTTLALTGGMTKMGMTASSAGVAIRNLGTKLIVMEKTAANMFNRNMDLANSFHDVNDGVNNSGKGFKITAEYLSQIAQQDAPKAIEMLSQLYKQGDVSLKTLVKIFTIKMFDFHSGNTMSKVA